jgi:hypothetical protein
MIGKLKKWKEKIHDEPKPLTQVLLRVGGLVKQG